MRRIDVLQSFCRDGHRKVFLAETINTMPGKFLFSLIYKDTMFVLRFRLYAIFFDIKLHELRSSFFKGYDAEAFTFSQNGECIMVRIEVIDIKGCNLTRSCP